MARGKNSKEDDGAADLINALNHPLRRSVLRLILDRGELSPNEASGLLEESLSNVSYHFRVLASDGAVTLVGTEQRRGSIEHFYAPSEEIKAVDWIRRVLPPGDSAAAA